VAWYRSAYAPRTGGAYDSHHRTAGIAGRIRLRGGRVAAAACAQQRPVPAALRYLVGPLITADKSDNIRTSSWYLSPERGTEAGTCTLICAKVQSEWSAVQSQIENYRAKAKEFARLSVIAKSLRHSRQYRKLAEMYWALALGEEAAMMAAFRNAADQQLTGAHSGPPKRINVTVCRGP